MLVPNERQCDQHFSSGLQYPSQLVEDLIQVEHVLEDLAGKHAVKLVVAKWQSLAVIIHVDVFAAVVVPAHGNVCSDIRLDIKQLAVRLASATKIEHPPRHVSAKTFDSAVQSTAYDEKGVEKQAEKRGLKQRAVVLFLEVNDHG